MTTDFLRAVLVIAGYENVAAACPKCGTRNVYNRAADIGHFRPIANATVTCESMSCGATFDICGDLVNSAPEMLALDACEFLREKRHMQAVLSATTAFEHFFNHFLRVELVYRPTLRDLTTVRDDMDWLNAAAARLRDKTARFTFEPMRRIFLRAAVDEARPATLAAAEAYIAGIPDRPKEVPRAVLERLPDGAHRTLLFRVHSATIAKLRNNIVHKTAYRPGLDETRAAVHDAYETIFGLSTHFAFGDDDYHLNESLEE